MIRAVSPLTYVELLALVTRRIISIDLVKVCLSTVRQRTPSLILLQLMWLIRLGLLRLCAISADDYQRRRFEVWNTVRVMSHQQCDLACTVEFESGRENRFVIRGFRPRHTWEIGWEGNIYVVLRSEHEELFESFEVGCGDPRVDIWCPPFSLDEHLITTFVDCSLPDQLHDKKPILCDLYHLVRIPRILVLLTPFWISLNTRRGVDLLLWTSKCS